MIRNSLFISTTALVLLTFGLISRLDFLAATKKALFLHCASSIAFFIALVGVNIFAALLAINRKILLKDTGRKLTHFDNQLQAGSPEGLPPFSTEKR